MRSSTLVSAGLLAAKACYAQSSANMWALSTDSQFDFQLQAILSMANGGGANTGEVLRAANQIVAGDVESFYAAFKYLGDEVHDMAASADAGGFLSSARDAYFRASTYYRAADFFIHQNKTDPRLLELWTAVLADFDRAVSLLPVPGESIAVPGTTANGTKYSIPVYFYSADSVTEKRNSRRTKAQKRPTVLIGTGYDGSQQDLYHSLCTSVVQSGFHCATYEGPGQPTVSHLDRLGFTTEWWTVVSPVADYLLSRPDVDGDRLALVGESFGGQLTPLALTHERRFAAVGLVDGIYSVFATAYDQFTAGIQQLYDAGNATAIDEELGYIYDNNLGGTTFKWAVDQGLWSFDTDSIYDWLRQLETYDINSTTLAAIDAPVFVGSGQNDTVAPGQAATVWTWLNRTAPSAYHLFPTALGAGEHCQVGAEGQLGMYLLEWVSGVFESVGSKTNGTHSKY